MYYFVFIKVKALRCLYSLHFLNSPSLVRALQSARITFHSPVDLLLFRSDWQRMTSVKRRTLMIPIEHTKTAYTYRSESQAQVMVSVAAAYLVLTG